MLQEEAGVEQCWNNRCPPKGRGGTSLSSLVGDTSLSLGPYNQRDQERN